MPARAHPGDTGSAKASRGIGAKPDGLPVTKERRGGRDRPPISFRLVRGGLDLVDYVPQSGSAAAEQAAERGRCLAQKIVGLLLGFVTGFLRRVRAGADTLAQECRRFVDELEGGVRGSRFTRSGGL